MIIQPPRDFPIVRKDSTGEDIFNGWIESVTRALNFLEPIEGTVSPEGVVKAPQKKYYFDTAAGELYFKTTDETLDTGWVQLT